MSGRRSREREALWLRLKALGGLSIGSNIYLLELVEGERVLFRMFLDAGLKITEDTMLDVDTMGRVRGILVDEKNIIEPFENTVQAIVVSHAHEDHVGMLPWIYRIHRKLGRRRPITYMSSVSSELFVTTQEELYDTVYGYAARRTKEYYGDEYFWDKNDIRACYIEEASYESLKRIHKDDISGGYEVHLKFYPSGHILGSCFVELIIKHERDERPLGHVLYTGDFSLRQSSFIVRNGYKSLERVKSAIPRYGPYDLLITEGTYFLSSDYKGDITDIKRELAKKIAEVFNRGGNLVLAVYGLDRAQNVLVCLRELVEALDAGRDITIPLRDHYPFEILFDTKIGQIIADQYEDYSRRVAVLDRCFSPEEKFRYEHEIRDELINRYNVQNLGPFVKSSGG